jgi:TRAP-type C4-dicarboxylate transport system permease small subunit
MLSILKKAVNGWAKLEVFLLAIILLLMILFAVLQIILRNVFDTSLFWIDPLNRLLVLWLALLGAMVATREKEHIAVDVLKHYVSGVWLSVVTKLAELFAGVVCGVMSFHSGRFVYFEYLDGMTTFSELPAWPFELIMPIGFGVMSIRFLVNVARPVQGAKP